MKLFEQKPVGMTASQWDKAKRIGSGRYSEGVRVAVEGPGGGGADAGDPYGGASGGGAVKEGE